jgi:xyloglucan-specific exo-beta-1,4-glucanase
MNLLFQKLFMKKTKLFFFLILSILSHSFVYSQLEELKTRDITNIKDLKYDLTIENRMYASTRGNHLVYSNDNGLNWSILHTEPNGFILEMNLAKNSNQLHFLHEQSNQYSIKFYSLQIHEVEKTIDLPSENGFPYAIKNYDVSEDEQTILVNSLVYESEYFSRTKIYKSSNGGQNWDLIYDSNEAESTHVNNLKMDPNNSEKFILARGIGNDMVHGGLWISENGGQTWSEHFEGITFNSIAFHPTNANEIWIGSGDNMHEPTETRLYKTMDGGLNWELINLEWTPFQKNAINGIAFHPIDPNYMVILEENEMATTADGGETWQYVSDPNPTNSLIGYYLATNPTFNPFNFNEYVADGRIAPFKISGENTLNISGQYFGSKGNVFVSQTPNNTIYVYYRNNNGLYEYNNYNQLANNIYSYGYIDQLAYFDPMIRVDKTNYGRLYQLHQHFYYGSDGELLNKRIFNVRRNYYDYAPVIVMETEAAEINEAVTFSSNPNLFVASFSDFGYYPQLFKANILNSENPEVTQIPLPLQSTGRVNYVEINESNPEEILIAQRARLYKTQNGGQTWIEINEGLEDLINTAALDIMESYDHISKVEKNPFNPHHYLMTTNKGVYESMDGANSWTKISTQTTQNVFISPKTEGHIILYTSTSENSDLTVKATSDGGNTWVEYPIQTDYHLRSGIGEYTSDVLFQEDSAQIFIGTEDLGIIVFTIEFETMNISDPVLLEQSKALIYPNPTTNFIQIASKKEVKEVQIYDLNGKLILISQNDKINVSHLISAPYIIKIIDEKGEITTSRFLKK